MLDRLTSGIEKGIHDAQNRGGGKFNIIDTLKLERLGINMYKAKAGDNFIKVIQPHPSSSFVSGYGITLKMHRKVGVDGRNFVCNKMFGEPCAVCDYIARIKGQEGSEAIIKDIRQADQNFLFVTDMLNQDTINKGLFLYATPTGVYDYISGASRDKRTGAVRYLCYLNDAERQECAQRGMVYVDVDIYFHKIGSGQNNTKYQSMDVTPSKWGINPAVAASVPNLDEFIIKPDYKTVMDEVAGHSFGSAPAPAPVNTGFVPAQNTIYENFAPAPVSMPVPPVAPAPTPYMQPTYPVAPPAPLPLMNQPVSNIVGLPTYPNVTTPAPVGGNAFPPFANTTAPLNGVESRLEARMNTNMPLR